jgi:hypothetical protein
MTALLHLSPPAAPELRPSATSGEALDELERSIASTIRQWRPGQQAPAFWQRRGGLTLSPSGAEAGGLIDAALKQSSAAHLQALSQSGLPISALALLQSWVELTVDARVMQQQLVMQRMINTLEAEHTSGGVPDTTANPAQPLSAVELGQALGGVSDETVRYREKAGELFSVLRPGRKRGREYPAFQAWGCVTDGTLARVLRALGAPWAPGTAAGTDAYSFFLSPTDLLGGLTPIEALRGSLTTARGVDAAAAQLLAASLAHRQAAVMQAAEAFAAQVSA